MEGKQHATKPSEHVSDQLREEQGKWLTSVTVTTEIAQTMRPFAFAVLVERLLASIPVTSGCEHRSLP
jgi:hypothetical protein